MSLNLYDTATRSVRPFVPISPGVVSMYQCGATVQAAPHVGHIRSGLVFDVLNRWLVASNFDVTLCRNVTDIDDKILAKSESEGRPWWAVATHYEREFTAAYDALGCIPPSVEPRATGHVTQIVALIERLIASGHAYDAGGDVYFDVRSYPAYGELSRQKLDDLRPAADSEADVRKRDPRDFALWKAAVEGPRWPTPWGDGRPGWHIECSAMATTYLGPIFDIHGGGLDLMFPHHENELAQARAAGDAFANYWIHNAWVTTSGEKMSKSLGNSLLVSHVLKRVEPIELRWYLVSAHYRSNLEFSDSALTEAAASFRRIEGFIHRAVEKLGTGDGAVEPIALPAEFVEAMNDDLGTPAAVAVIHEHVTRGNSYLTDRTDEKFRAVLGHVRRMLAVLGVDPLDPMWLRSDATATQTTAALEKLVQSELVARATARAAKDFATADAIRDRIADAGITIEDTADGARWSLTEGK